MPDPWVFCQAVGAAAGAGAPVALVLGWLNKRGGRLIELGYLVAFLGGAVAGYAVFPMRPAWPPASGLDRFLAVVLPIAVAIEAVVILGRLRPRPAWLLRVTLAVATGRILLHGSVYLSGGDGSWSEWQTWGMLAASSGLLTLVWSLLTLFERRRDGQWMISVALAMAMAIVTAGMAILLAGYIKGGAAALPLAASLTGVALTAGLTRRTRSLGATIAVAVVALYCLLFIGLFFGRLTGGNALVILLAPSALWIVELSPLGKQRAWIAAALGLLLVATVLAVVLVRAKLDFDRKLAPLVGDVLNHSRSASALTDETTT